MGKPASISSNRTAYTTALTRPQSSRTIANLRIIDRPGSAWTIPLENFHINLDRYG